MLYPLSYGGDAIILPPTADIGTVNRQLKSPSRLRRLELGAARANIRNERIHKRDRKGRP